MTWRAVVLAFGLGTALHAAPPAKIVTDAAHEQIKRDLIRDAYSDVSTYFAQRHDLILDQSFVLVGTDTPDAMADMLTRGLLALGRRPRSAPIDTDSLCANRRIGAAANRNYILMCWREPASYGPVWRKEFAPRFTGIMAHEFTHQMQYQLARDHPPRRDPVLDDWLLGPEWMVEGTAEVIEKDYVTPIGALTGKDIYDMQNRARRSRLTLSDLTRTGSVKGSAAYGVSRFASLMLARKHGIDALFAYFTALGTLRDRDRAFELAFGQSFEAFEKEFEVLRRDFGAARDYGRDSS